MQADIQVGEPMQKSRTKPIKHGRQEGYRKGCRCDDCREARNRADRIRYAKKTGNAWWNWAKKKLDDAIFGDSVLLSFKDETQYYDFNKKYGRGKYRIDHTLTDHQSGRFHIWVVRL